MRIALVAPTYLAARGGLERRVDQLARGLAARGAEVEILTQGTMRWEQHSLISPGVALRRFPSVVGRLRFAVAPGLYEGLRAAADEFDLVDVHTGYAPLAFAVTRAKFARRILTPYGAAHRLTSGPYAYLARRPVVDSYAQVVCSSGSERELLCRRFPWAAERIRVVLPGVDVDAIEAASAYPSSRGVVLAVARLERSNGIDRAIAAMAATDASLRLLVIGDGSARERLQAYAADLRLTLRVDFAGSLPDHELYRWLRSARVVVALPEQHGSGLELLEALAVGTPVVASDIPAHREVVAQFANPPVVFVPPTGSPLQVADAIADAAGRPVHAYTDESLVRSWESVVDDTWELYRELIDGPASTVTTRQVLG
jgi:glycosyltransferase involved in cell wall biosynthesis